METMSFEQLQLTMRALEQSRDQLQIQNLDLKRQVEELKAQPREMTVIEHHYEADRVRIRELEARTASGFMDRILVVAPHCDDETLGCGGMLAKYASAQKFVQVMTAGSVYYPHLQREVGSRERVEELIDALNVLGDITVGKLMIPEFESFLDTYPQRNLVEKLDSVIKLFQPTAVFLPYPGHHQDHRATFEAGVAACRPHPGDGIKLLATYEYPYATGFDFRPQSAGGYFYVDISDVIEKKMTALVCHESQVARHERHALHPDSVRALARMRGVDIGVAYAERFQILRMVQ